MHYSIDTTSTKPTVKIVQLLLDVGQVFLTHAF